MTAPTAQDVVDAWNSEFPVGTPVRYWLGPIYGAGHLGKTTSEARVLFGDTPMVQIGFGTIPLDHIDPCPEDGAA